MMHQLLQIGDLSSYHIQVSFESHLTTRDIHFFICGEAAGSFTAPIIPGAILSIKLSEIKVLNHTRTIRPLSRLTGLEKTWQSISVPFDVENMVSDQATHHDYSTTLSYRGTFFLRHPINLTR